MWWTGKGGGEELYDHAKSPGEVSDPSTGPGKWGSNWRSVVKCCHRWVERGLVRVLEPPARSLVSNLIVWRSGIASLSQPLAPVRLRDEGRQDAPLGAISCAMALRVECAFRRSLTIVDNELRSPFAQPIQKTCPASFVPGDESTTGRDKN